MNRDLVHWAGAICGYHDWPQIIVLALCSLGFAQNTNAQSTNPDTVHPAWQLESPPSYTPVAALREDASLQAIAFSPDGQFGVAVGNHGVILRSDDAGDSWEQRPSPVECVLNDVVWLNDQVAIAVGGQYDRITRMSRGVVLISENGGNRWRRSGDEELPFLRSIERRREGGALVAVGDWSSVAESREFESHDRGRTWNSTGGLDGSPPLPDETPSATRLAWVQATGALTVVRDVAEVRTNATWFAACDHGMILKGDPALGKWSTVRGEHRRTSLLIVARDPATIPWPLVGSEGLEMRQRISIVLASALHGIHPQPPSQPITQFAEQSAIDLSSARQAAANVGAASVDVIDTTVATDQAMFAEAKNWIAIHRPAVIVLDDSLDKGLSDAFSQIAISAGVQRVVRCSRSADGDKLIHNSAMLASIGTMAGDLAEDAMQLIAPEANAPQMISLRSIYDASGKTSSGESITSGISISPAQKRSGRLPRATRRQLQVVQARLTEDRRIDRMIETSSDENVFTTSLISMLDQTATGDQLRLAWTIYKRLQSADLETTPQQIAFQDRLLSESSDRFGGLSFGKWANLRREAINGSSEWQNLRSLSAQALTTQQSKTRSEQAVQQVAVSPFQIEASGVVQASGSSPIRVASTTPTKIQGNVDVDGRNRRQQNHVDLRWEFHPLVLIAGESARLRSQVDNTQALPPKTGNFRRLTDSTLPNPWADLVVNRPLNQILASVATRPPKLDGISDDPFWMTTNDDLDTQPRTPSVKMGYDEQFVYFFIRCPSNQFAAERSIDDTASHRDFNLTATDRLRLAIDVDRDLMTAFELQSTPQGKTHDAIDGQSAWQPTWYVSTKEHSERIDFEIAVLRRDLVELPIQTGDKWFVSAQIVPAGVVSTPGPIPNPRLWKPVSFR